MCLGNLLLYFLLILAGVFDVNQLCDVPAYRGLLLFALAAHDRDIVALVGVCGEFSCW